MRLHANLTSPSPKPVSQRTLNFGDGIDARHMTLVLGKYLLVLQKGKLRCYDLDLVVETTGVAIQPIAFCDLPKFDIIHNPVVDTTVDEGNHVYDPIVIAALLSFKSHMKM
jgi:hypothetical protein